MGLTWATLLKLLQDASSTVFSSAIWLLDTFTTPFGVLIDRDLQVAQWVVDLLAWITQFLGIDILVVTPLQLMLGSTIPLIIVFTIFRYVKQ